MARILLTGGSGDLGGILVSKFHSQGHDIVNLDIAEPASGPMTTFKGSITDRDLVAKAMQGVDLVVHIAAWHGIHEPDLTPYDFHDLNVTGTMTVFEEAAKAGCKKVVFVSSTSVSKPYGVYGHTKVLSEEICRAYSHRHNMDVLILRPRAFVPPWNSKVYSTFTEWANWFIPGAVHIYDVARATDNATSYLLENSITPEVPVLNVDGAYDYTDEDLATWDAEGEGSTFIKRYGQGAHDLLTSEGIKVAVKPRILDISLTRDLLGYKPHYSLQNLIEEVQSL